MLEIHEHFFREIFFVFFTQASSDSEMIFGNSGNVYVLNNEENTSRSQDKNVESSTSLVVSIDSIHTKETGDLQMLPFEN